MNCIECRMKAEEFLKQALTLSESTLVLEHLQHCESCKNEFAASMLLNKTIVNEQREKVNPFMATRVMAKINSMPQQQQKVQVSITRDLKLQPLLVAASVALMIFIGIKTGNLISENNSKNQVPEEWVYFDDATMESLPVLTND